MKIIKKLIIAFALTALSATAQAEDEKKFSGFYLGGEVGYLDIGPDKGFALGGFLGGRYQTDSNIVFGAELDVIGTTSDDSTGLFSLVGTVGITTGDDNRNLLYVGGGITSGLGLDDIEGFNLLGSDDGYTIVTGFERAMTDNFHLRLQGKYTDFSSEGANDDPDLESNIKSYGVSLGLIYQF